MNTSVEIQKYFYDSIMIIIRKYFIFLFLVTSVSTTHTAPFVSQKEKQKKRILKPKWKNPK